MSEVIAMEANEPATMFGKLPAGWGIRQLRDIVPDHRRVTYGIVQPGIHDPQGVLLIRGQDYIKGWAEPDEFFRVARPLHEIFKRSTTIAGDLLICIVGATTGATNIVPAWIHEANITQTTARIACDSRKADSYFVLFALASEIGQRQVRKYVKGSAQPGMNLADVECFHIPLPPLPQQRKIARILTTLDNVITQTEALIAKYQAIKQGLMHDLFTRGVDATGKLRPPQSEAPELYKQSELGWIPMEWEVERVGNMFEMQLGKMLSRASKTGRYSFPYLANRNVQWEHVDVSTLETMDFSELEREKFALRAGDLLVCEGGEIARTSIWRNEHPECYYQKAIHRLRSIAACVTPEFMLRFMRYAVDRGWFTNFVSQSSIAHLTREKLAVVPMLVPPPDEQSEVAKRFDAIDRLIYNETISLRKLHSTKPGLMQDLLTGKVSVKADEVTP